MAGRSGPNCSAAQRDRVVPGGRRQQSTETYEPCTRRHRQGGGQVGGVRGQRRDHRVFELARLADVADPRRLSDAGHQGRGEVVAPPGQRRVVLGGEGDRLPQQPYCLVELGDRIDGALETCHQADPSRTQHRRFVCGPHAGQPGGPAPVLLGLPQILAVLCQLVPRTQRATEVDQPHAEDLVPFGGERHRLPMSPHSLVQLLWFSRALMAGDQHEAEIVEHRGAVRLARRQVRLGILQQAQRLVQVRSVRFLVAHVAVVEGHRGGEERQLRIGVAAPVEEREASLSRRSASSRSSAAPVATRGARSALLRALRTAAVSSGCRAARSASVNRETASSRSATRPVCCALNKAPCPGRDPPPRALQDCRERHGGTRPRPRRTPRASHPPAVAQHQRLARAPRQWGS